MRQSKDTVVKLSECLFSPNNKASHLLGNLDIRDDLKEYYGFFKAEYIDREILTYVYGRKKSIVGSRLSKRYRV